MKKIIIIITMLFVMSGCMDDIIGTTKLIEFNSAIKVEAPWNYRSTINVYSVIALASYFATLEEFGPVRLQNGDISIEEREKAFKKNVTKIRESDGYKWKRKYDSDKETYLVSVYSKNNSFKLDIRTNVINKNLYVNINTMKVRIYGIEVDVADFVHN